MLMIYSKHQQFFHRIKNCVCSSSRRFPFAKADVWKWQIDTINSVLVATAFWQNWYLFKIRRFSPLILMFLTADCWEEKGPVKTHSSPAQIRSLSLMQLSILELFARKRIMNDSEGWTKRSLLSSDPCLQNPKRSASMHQEHYLLKPWGQIKLTATIQNWL